ncbi:MAG: DUF4175 family protein [bacterium]
MPQVLYQELVDRLTNLRKKRQSLRLRNGLYMGGSFVVIAIFLALSVEAIFHFSVLARTILFFSAFGVATASFLFFALAPILEYVGLQPTPSHEALLKQIGTHFNQVQDKLLNVYQLSKNLATEITPSFGSTSFTGAAFTRTYSEVRGLDFNEILNRSEERKSFIFFLIISAVFVGSFVGAKSEMFGATERLIHFRTFYQKPAPFTFNVVPGNASILRSTAIKVVTTLSGEQLSSIFLRVKESGGNDFDKIELHATSDSSKHQRRFVYEFHPLHQTEYYLEAEGIESEHFTVSVLDHPTIKVLSLTLEPPTYTHGKSNKLADNFGDINALYGTKSDFTIQSSKPLRSAQIIFTQRVDKASSDTSTTSPATKKTQAYPLSVNGMSASASLNFHESGTYHVELLDQDSIVSEHPIEYSVALTSDEAPSILLIEPGEHAELPSNQRLSMVMKVHDDYGFSSVKLGYRIRSSKYIPEQKEYKWLDIPLSNYLAQDLDVPYIWNLVKLELAPQDEVGYVLEVADNDIISGPKKSRTSEYSVRYPSVEEIFKRADEQSNQAVENLKDIKQDAEELKKKIDAAIEEMRPAKTTDLAKKQQEFTVKKDAEQILKRQEELNNRVADVKKDLEQMTKQLQEQQAISPETMQKYQELQKLFQEIKSPELDLAMKKLEDAMKNVDPKQMQDALKKFQFNEEQFKKSLERTANILKKIKMEQKVDELMKRSDRLAKEQEKAAEKQNELSKKNAKQSPEEKSADERRAKDAQNELDRMKQEAKDVAKDMKKLPESMQAPEEMQEAQEALNDPSMGQAMDDAEKAMEKGDNEKASQRSQDAAEKAKKARNKLSQLKKKLAQNEKQKTMADMKKLRDEMNRLSKAEEDIKNKTISAPPLSNVFRNFADEQADRKEELGNAASEMMQAAQRSPEFTAEMGKTIGEAFANMQEALDAMTERDQSSAIQHSQQAMAALNKTSEAAQAALASMAKAGKGAKGQPGDGPAENPGGSTPGDQMGDGPPSAMQQFLSQIEKLTAQQQALNDQMQGMMNGKGGAQQEAMRQQAQLGKMAAEQQGVQKSMEDLLKEQQQSKAGNKSAQEELKKIADEMQEVVSDMREKGINPETIQRQERILSRLLEAQRAVNERDKDQSRQSKPGENIRHDAPRDLDLRSDATRRALRDELLRSKDGGFSKDYQILIHKYLEKISEP